MKDPKPTPSNQIMKLGTIFKKPSPPEWFWKSLGKLPQFKDQDHIPRSRDHEIIYDLLVQRILDHDDPWPYDLDLPIFHDLVIPSCVFFWSDTQISMISWSAKESFFWSCDLISQKKYDLMIPRVSLLGYGIAYH